METGNADDTIDADVAIVGYGPVGSVLSILLAQQGHRVVALERFTATYPLPRAVHFDGEVARIFQACGIGDQLPGLSSSSGVYEWRNASGDTLLRFLPVADSGTGWPGGNMFCQPELEGALERRARGLDNLDLQRGVEVTGLAPTLDTVTLSTSGGPVRARLAVGCDGANSPVRTWLDTPVTDLGFFYDWLICDVIFHQPRPYEPENLQVCDPARPTTVVSGGPGRRRWEFMRLPGEDKATLDTEQAAWDLLAPWDVHPGNARLERHVVYTFQARWVDRWRTGRVLLAGDAAHLMPPFAGQGLCSGVRDAANLAWKLGLVLDGHAPMTLLDTYQQERQPHVRATIELSMELGNVICVPDAEAAAQRDQAMMAALAATGAAPMPPGPVVTDGLFAPGDGAAGHLLVQGRVARGGVPQSGVGDRFDDVAGLGWRLLCRPSSGGAVDAGLRDWFGAIGGAVLTVGPGGDLADVDDTYTRWFDQHDADAVLQRPDFRIYGHCPRGSAAATDLLASLRTTLAG